MNVVFSFVRIVAVMALILPFSACGRKEKFAEPGKQEPANVPPALTHQRAAAKPKQIRTAGRTKAQASHTAKTAKDNVQVEVKEPEELAQAVSDGEMKFQDLVVMLKNTDDSVAEQAARALALIGTHDSLNALVDAIKQAPSNARKDLLAEAGEDVCTESAKEPLLNLLETQSDPQVLDMAQAGLAAIASPSIIGEIYERFKKAANSDIADNYADTVRQMSDPELVPSLVALARPGDAGIFSELSAAAVETLATIGTPDAARYLLTRILSAGKDEAVGLAMAIERVREYDSLPVLREAAEGGIGRGDALVRTAALHALGNFDDAENTQFLKRTMESSPDQAVRAAASNALERIRRYEEKTVVSEK